MQCKPISKFEKFAELVAEVNEVMTRVGFIKEVSQISLQVSDPEDSSPESWYRSCGRIQQQNRLIIETQFKYIHPKLKGGYIDQCLQSLAEYRIVRTRLMLVNPRTCYSIHSDPYPRIHIPVITNNQCLFCFPESGAMEYLPADGTSYYVDTTKKHTFINCSTVPRVHLVGVVLP
jgi:hypothetical protein